MIDQETINKFHKFIPALKYKRSLLVKFNNLLVTEVLFVRAGVSCVCGMMVSTTRLKPLALCRYTSFLCAYHYFTIEDRPIFHA